MKKPVNIVLLLILLGLLILIRFFEKHFFDDGLTHFFEFKYQTDDLPKISFLRNFLMISIRFWLNSIISIAVLNILFKQKKLVQFLFIVYTFSFFVLSALYFWQWYHYQAGEYLNLFYIRRFLIQPIMLFLLIPALIYQKHKNN